MNANRVRIEKLQEEMAAAGMDMYLVPTADFHQSEYVGAYFKVRAWLSGFTGCGNPGGDERQRISLDRRAVFYPGGKRAGGYRYYPYENEGRRRSYRGPVPGEKHSGGRLSGMRRKDRQCGPGKGLCGHDGKETGPFSVPGRPGRKNLE